MAIQFSVAVRNARLDAVETTIGTSPTMEIRSGAVPANCAAADSGTVLATVTLPSDWLAAASSGTKDFLGTWQDTSADASGTAGHFRIKQSSTCHMQGTCGTSGADMIFVTTSLTATQPFQVTAFTLTEGNA
jgi:hypothetical protein